MQDLQKKFTFSAIDKSLSRSTYSCQRENSFLADAALCGIRQPNVNARVWLQIGQLNRDVICQICIDYGQVTLWPLLHVRSVFDTMDHNILLTRLSTSYRIACQGSIRLADLISEWADHGVEIGPDRLEWAVPYSIPQGWLPLGPLLYILYIADQTQVSQPLKSVCSTVLSLQPTWSAGLCIKGTEG